MAQQPLFRVVDMNVGDTNRVEFPDGKSSTVKLPSICETRDTVRFAVREACAEVEINGSRGVLVCGNYCLPVALGGVQVDCTVTKAYYQNSGPGGRPDELDSHLGPWPLDALGLQKDARLRLWPAGSTFMQPGSMVYPLRQRWFASLTRMGNEPTYANGSERIGSDEIYYHSGL
jgi:hypothetical protein